MRQKYATLFVKEWGFPEGGERLEKKIYSFHELQTIIVPIMKSYGVKRAWLFGSYAHETADEQSDIDLRIDGGRIKSMFGLGALYEELIQALKKPVDLVTTEALLHKANEQDTRKFRKDIEKYERLIYEERY